MRPVFESRQPSNTPKSSKRSKCSSHSSPEESQLSGYGSEDDMYIFDKPLQQPPTLDPGHDFMTIKDLMTAYSWEMFLESQSSHGRQSGSRNWSIIQNQPENMAKDQSTEIIHESTIPKRRHFACPFYIHNPKKYLKCFTRSYLLNIKDVKQHLWNAHRLQPYCPTCGDVFATTTESDAHIRSRSCNPQSGPRPEGISLPQMQQLARRAEDWMSENLQWLSLWEIVFPGAEWPNFTYPSRTVESMVCQFRDYWTSCGETVMYDFLHGKGFCDDILRDEKDNLVALHALILNQVIDRLFERFENDDDSTVSTKVEEVLTSLRCS